MALHTKIKMVMATLARKCHRKAQVSCGSAWFQIKGKEKDFLETED